VAFSAAGVILTEIRPEDTDEFAELMAALAPLGQPPTPTPLPIRVGGIDVPVPMGAQYSKVISGHYGDEGAPGQLSLGGSYIRFNNYGVIESHIQPEHEEAFAPTLEALALLSPP
jgi:hypothetical protein